MSALFMIGTTDYTRQIKLPSYKVNRTEIYTEWTDGYNITHRDISRYKISGTFDLYFRSAAEYKAFMNAVNSAKTSGGYVACTVYDNKTMTTYASNFYIDMTPVDNMPQLGHVTHDALTVTITER